MKILHVNAFDSGGAARAAVRLHEGLKRDGIDSHFVTIKPNTGQGPSSTPLGKFQVASAYAKRHLASRIMSLQTTPTNEVVHSLSMFPSGLGRWINLSGFDIVNLHWVCAEALSIGEIAKIQKPIVWTMHDMWPFAGAEHYDDLDNPGRWKAPYTAENRPRHYGGLDLDRYVWKRKAKLWSGKKFNLVSPSRWLANCAFESALMGNQTCEVIPNPIDTDFFAPIDKATARRMLGLPIDARLVLFGAVDAMTDRRKGYDLLIAALQRLAQLNGEKRPEVIVFGGKANSEMPGVMLKWHSLGAFQDELSLRVIYSAADVFVAPSRQDNLPNTVVEAGVCGVPTAAFDVGGMSDIVTEGQSGLLVRPFDTNALADAVEQLLETPISPDVVSESMRAKYSSKLVLPHYISLYERVLENRT